MVRPATSAEITFLPSRDQELLLKASLLGKLDAGPAWKEWKRLQVIDRADVASFRLLPLLYRNLRREGIREPDRERLKGTYRHCWSRNRILMRRLSQILNALEEAGVETMVLKGAALTSLYYRDFGVRPMADIDVLVRPGDARRAIRILRKAGWERPSSEPIETSLRFRHARPFRNQAGDDLDLHWRPFRESAVNEVGETFWDAAVPLEIEGIRTRAMCPADTLLQTVSHGIHDDPVALLRWIADAHIVICESGSTLDWARLLKLASNQELVLRLRRGLRYLVATFGTPVPGEILTKLARLPVSRLERMEYRFCLQDEQERASRSALEALLSILVRHLRGMRGEGIVATALSAPAYFGFYLEAERRRRGLSSKLEVLLAAAARRIKRTDPGRST